MRLPLRHGQRHSRTTNLKDADLITMLEESLLGFVSGDITLRVSLPPLTSTLALRRLPPCRAPTGDPSG